jgi:hypothetical protein
MRIEFELFISIIFAGVLTGWVIFCWVSLFRSIARGYYYNRKKVTKLNAACLIVLLIGVSLWFVPMSSLTLGFGVLHLFNKPAETCGVVKTFEKKWKPRVHDQLYFELEDNSKRYIDSQETTFDELGIKMGDRICFVNYFTIQEVEEVRKS